ncbi:hypothetical protein [Cellulomonas sp. NS3]|uniref:hypothetical protein n=1 Tax=Cellulomonas sp. NS3 TaxID=2973977 RepID=UPI0021618A9B|nr:hypothetical protein [Cellulomonas sp. NS3]
MPNWLPYQQGDVFDGVELPNLTSGPVMVFMHPCSMRQKTGMRERLTVLQVRTESPRKLLDDPERWRNRNKVMPLPGLRSDTSTHVADFMEIATVQVSELPRTARIAQLSTGGRLHLQHRLVFHLTRHAPKIDDLEVATSGVELEALQQADWVEMACGSQDDAPLEVVESHELEYQTFLDAPEYAPSLREMLYSPRAPEAVRMIQRTIAGMRETPTS